MAVQGRRIPEGRWSSKQKPLTKANVTFQRGKTVCIYYGFMFLGKRFKLPKQTIPHAATKRSLNWQVVGGGCLGAVLGRHCRRQMIVGKFQTNLILFKSHCGHQAGWLKRQLMPDFASVCSPSHFCAPPRPQRVLAVPGPGPASYALIT